MCLGSSVGKPFTKKQPRQRRGYTRARAGASQRLRARGDEKMFWLEFVGLTLVYLAIAMVIIALIAQHHEEEFREYFRGDETWFWMGLGAFVVTLVIACFNFGPALLLPEKIPSVEQRNQLWDTLSYVLYGSVNPSAKRITEPLPWATGTWFWWKAAGIYFLFCLSISVDSLVHAFHSAVALIRRRQEEEHRRTPSPVVGPAAPPGTGGGTAAPVTGWRIFEFSSIAEIVWEFVFRFFEHRRRGGA